MELPRGLLTGGVRALFSDVTMNTGKGRSERNMAPEKIRVLLVDDHALVRAGLKALLEMHDDIEVVGEAADGEEALRQVREKRPDVVLLDVMMPGLSALSVLRQLRKTHPEVRVLILSQYGHPAQVLPLLENGAAGYLLKEASDADVVRAVRVVHEGKTYLYPPIAKMVVDALACGREHAPEGCLTQREREVLILVAQGYTNKEIARLLGISPKTVDVHRTRMMKKLNLHNVADIVRYAVRHRLIDPWA